MSETIINQPIVYSILHIYLLNLILIHTHTYIHTYIYQVLKDFSELEVWVTVTF